jgi:hypothetical protein
MTTAQPKSNPAGNERWIKTADRIILTWKTFGRQGVPQEWKDFAEHYLHLYDETPLDEAWLQKVGFIHKGGDWVLPDADGCNSVLLDFHDNTETGDVFWFVWNGLSLVKVFNRGQLRRLFDFLGVPLGANS